MGSEPTEDTDEVPYFNLGLEATEEFLPDALGDDENLKSVLFTGFLRILTSYVDTEDEPWVMHPGDEYIIANLEEAVENPQYKWTEWYSPYATLSEGEYRAHGTDLIDFLEDEYGPASESHGPIRFKSKQIIRPAGSLTKDDLTDYSPGDGLYRDRPEVR